MIAIVPFRAGDRGRTEGAHFVLSHLREFGARVVVVEQAQKRSNLVDVDDHLLLSESGSFNRSRCFNVGVRCQRGRSLASDAVLFIDADVVCSHASLHESVAALASYGAVSPYDRIFDLSESASLALREGKTPETGQARGGTNLAGGALVMTFSAWETVGGWDEAMVGWGGEDDLMAHTIGELVPNLVLRCDAYHLWHERRSVDWDEYQHNRRHLERVRDLSADGLREEARSRLARIYARALPEQLRAS